MNLESQNNKRRQSFASDNPVTAPIETVPRLNSAAAAEYKKDILSSPPQLEDDGSVQ